MRLRLYLAEYQLLSGGKKKKKRFSNHIKKGVDQWKQCGIFASMNLTTSVSSDYCMTLVTLLSLKLIFFSFFERRTQKIGKNKEKEVRGGLGV